MPAKNFDEFLAWARANKGKLSYASYTPGTPSHFLGEQLTRKFDLDLTHVAYRGSGPQANDLLAGHALLGFTQLQSVMELVKAGKLNALATTGAARSRYLADVPNFCRTRLSGIRGDDMVRVADQGRHAAGDPRPADGGDRRRAQGPEARAKLEAVGFDVSGETGEAFRATIEAETRMLGRTRQGNWIFGGLAGRRTTGGLGHRLS